MTSAIGSRGNWTEDVIIMAPLPPPASLHVELKIFGTTAAPGCDPCQLDWSPQEFHM